MEGVFGEIDRKHGDPVTEQVVPGLWSIPVPIPDNPLGYTLVYLFETDRGAVLIDAGWDDDASWNMLLAGMQTAGYQPHECYGVLVTHVHADHHGLSSRVREASGAWIALHPLDSTMIAKHERANRAEYVDELASVLLDAGATESELATSARGKHRRQRQAPLAVPDRTLGDGELVDVPGWRVEAVWTPGHSPGHTCFRVPDHGLLLAGDHVLPNITPHIAISRSDRNGDPLGDFLLSLSKVDQPDIVDVLPAHEHRFTHLHERVLQIQEHHRVHLEKIEGLLTAGALTLWDIARQLEWNRPWDDLNLAMKRAAVNETAAHLRYLSVRGRANRLRGIRPFTFEAAG